MLRGLYERAVTLAYLAKNPHKAERFVRYAAVQEHKVLMAALKVVSEQDFDAVTGPVTTAAQIRKFYQEIKHEYQETVCKKCGKMRTVGTWDLDVASMVHSVGDGFESYYLGAYAVPNLHIHATLTSAFCERATHNEADSALFHASAILIHVVRVQNVVFALGLDDHIAISENDLVEVWLEPG